MVCNINRSENKKWGKKIQATAYHGARTVNKVLEQTEPKF
jgi:hypothetical protein